MLKTSPSVIGFISCVALRKKINDEIYLNGKTKSTQKTLKIKVVLLHIILVHHKQFFLHGNEYKPFKTTAA